MILPIVAYGSSVLRQTTEKIDKDDPGLEEIIANMYETMEASNGIGLAAPQVGKAIRLFLVDASVLEDVKPANFKKTFINPTIEEEWDTPWDFEEGCLSIPNVRENVKRNAKIRITYQDENFKKHTEEYDGMIARIIQHEYDHIEGILFTDRIHPIRRQFLKKRLENISRGRVDVAYKMKFPKR
jgi:peptide deformylase